MLATIIAIAAAIIALETRRDLRAFNRRIRTMSDKYDDLIQKLNDGTSAVAARLDKLTAQVAADAAAGKPASDAQIAEFASIATHLQAMGTDPSDPVPQPAPVPTPATGDASGSST